jgi:hypothetical protein
LACVGRNRGNGVPGTCNAVADAGTGG